MCCLARSAALTCRPPPAQRVTWGLTRELVERHLHPIKNRVVLRAADAYDAFEVLV